MHHGFIEDAGLTMLTIGRNDLQQILVSCPDLKLIEVLPEASYQDYHLRGAINIPLDEHFEKHISEQCPDPSQTLIVYGLNFECQNSKQAIERLTAMGYPNILNYEPGKVDWKAAQLPIVQGQPGPNPLERHLGLLFSISLTQFPLFEFLRM